MTRLSNASTALVAVAFLTSACAVDGRGQPIVDNRTVGAVVGAVAGGALGSRFGEGSGKKAATIGGALAGAALGSLIAQDLSANGRRRAEATTQGTLSRAPTGATARWEDPETGIYGTVTPTTEIYRAPPQTVYIQPGYSQYQPTRPRSGYVQPPQTYATSSARECRDYETSVVVNGRPEQAIGTMCRNSPNEPWRLQN